MRSAALLATLLVTQNASAELARVHEQTGSARYSISLLVPEGVAGHAPEISLEYDSRQLRGGAGVVGLGWSIGGLGRIERDRKFGPPFDYASTACAPEYCYRDRFVLDGIDLVCSDEPCADRYRTQVDDGRRIEFRGDVWGFEIRDRDGRRFFYGSTAAARIGPESTRNGEVFAWLLERIEDASGNWIQFRYSGGEGVAVPVEIEYAQSGALGNRRIRFLPEASTRPDLAIDYSAGFRQVVDRRISEVVVEAKDETGSWQPVTRYELGYAQSPDSDRSLLTSVRRSGDVGGRTESLPVYRFTYSESSHAFDPPIRWAASWMGAPPVQWRTITNVWAAALHFNGDALADYVTAYGFGSQPWGSLPTSVYTNLGHDEFGVSPGDPNFSPFLFPPEQYAWWPEKTPVPKRTDTETAVSHKLQSTYEQIVDLDGDGYADWVRMTVDGSGLLSCEEGWPVHFGAAAGLSSTETTWTGVARNQSTDTSFPTQSLNAACAWSLSHGLESTWGLPSLQVELVDLTGDGRPDRVLSHQLGASGWRVGVNTGSGFLPLIDWAISDPDRIEEQDPSMPVTRRALLLDVNADGLPDRLYRGASGWGVAYNTGAGFEALEPLLYGFDQMRRIEVFNRDGLDVDVRDLNGDGYPDQVLSQGSAFWVWLGTGLGFRAGPLLWDDPAPLSCLVTQSVRDTGEGGDLADYNGDGLLDRSCDTLNPEANGRGGFGRIALNAGPVPDLLLTATHPIGGSARFEYGHAAGEEMDGAVVAHPELPQPRWVVKRLSRSDGRPESPDIVDEFAYLGGTFDRREREFRAFEEVTRTRIGAGGTAESVVVSAYRTDRACAGKLWARNVYAGSARIAGESHDYLELPPSPPAAPADQQWTACLLTSSTFEAVEGDEAAKRGSRTVRDYGAPVDPFYNVSVLREYGAWDLDLGVDIPGDERFTFFEYAASIDPDFYRVSKLSLIRVEEATGETVSSTRFFYDSLESAPLVARGRLTAVEGWLHADVGGGVDRWVRLMTLEHDAYGNPTASTGAATVTASGSTELRRETEYDPVHQTFPVSVTLGAGTATPLVTRLSYRGCADGEEPPPALGLPCSVTSPQGVATSFGYDALGRIRITASPTGLRTRVDPFLPGPGGPAETRIQRTLDFADPSTPDLVSNEYRDGLGRIYRTEQPGKATEVIVVERRFDPRGRLSSESMPHFSAETAPLLREFRYDPVGRPTVVIDYDGTTFATHSYAPWRTVEEVYFGDPPNPLPADRQRRTERVSDGLGRLIEVRQTELPRTPGTAFSVQAEYDAADRLRTLRDPVAVDEGLCQTHGMGPSCTAQSHTTELYYDSFGNRLRLIDPDVGTWSHAYTDSGLLRSEVNPNSDEVELTYDALERVATRSVDGQEWTFSYGTAGSARGQLVAVSTPSGVSRVFAYDALGRRSAETQIHTDTTPSLAFTNTYEYDELGRVATRGFPDRTSAEYSYDGLRLVGISIDATFVPLSGAEYDALGRPTSLVREGAGTIYGPQAPVAYEYDGPGKRLSRILATRRHSFYGTEHSVLDVRLAFDGLGRLSVESETSEDAGGGSRTIQRSFEYDGLGRLDTARGPWEKIYGNDADVVWAFTYDPLGSVRELGSDSGYYRRWSYDDASRPRFLTRFVEARPGVPDLIQDVTPDPAGFTATVSRLDGGVEEFVWNGHGRLETIRGKGFRNTYDAFGKRVRQHVVTGAIETDIIYVGDDFAYDVEIEQSNRFFFVGGIAIASAASFCAPADCYSAAGLLIPPWGRRDLGPWAAPAGALLALVALFGTAALALGVRRPAWVGGAGVGAMACCLVLLPDSVWSGSAGSPSRLGSHSEGLVFYVSDHLGSTRAVVSWYGELIETRDYDPWGRSISHGGDFALLHRFTGQPFEFDDPTAGPELYNYGARMYDPVWGRFVSPDAFVQSLDPQGLNRYSYVGNQPTSMVDPTGNFWESLEDFVPPPPPPVGFDLGDPPPLILDDLFSWDPPTPPPPAGMLLSLPEFPSWHPASIRSPEPGSLLSNIRGFVELLGPIGFVHGVRETFRQNDAYYESQCAEQGSCLQTGVPPLAVQRLALLRLLQLRRVQLLERGGGLVETVGVPKGPLPGRVDPSNPPPLPPGSSFRLRATLFVAQLVRAVRATLGP